MKIVLFLLVVTMMMSTVSSQYVRRFLAKRQNNLREDGGLAYETNDAHGNYFNTGDRIHPHKKRSYESSDAQLGTVQIGQRYTGSSTANDYNNLHINSRDENLGAYDDHTHTFSRDNERNIDLLNPDDSHAL